MNDLTEMTDAEERELRALGEELASVDQSPWEPRCIAAAFYPPANLPVLTMERWIALDAIQSPLLLGKRPSDLETLESAANIFALSARTLSAEEAILLGNQLLEVVNGAFAMALRMRQPGSEQDAGGAGFGSWLPLFTCLLVDCGMPAADVRAFPVGQAFAVLAAMRRNQGWEPAETSYAQRDVFAAESATAD